MPNQEHLALLRQGVNIWNQWRKENPKVRPDFRELKLGKAILTRADLSGADLRGANLRKSDLSKLPSGANVTGKLVVGDPPQFSKFDYPFADVSLSGADFREADLRNANLSEADLRGANLNNANLSEVDLREASFYEATIIGMNLSKANLGKANLSKVRFSNINFCQTDIKEANLSRAFLCQSDFSNADLIGSDLSEANLSLAKLHKANLAGANLVAANLADAILSKANLNDADLSLTRALGTDFTGAQLTGACLGDWSYNSKTKLNSVICDYVYLKREKQERRPHSENFASGQFTKFFQQALETVDLIFSNGIDWKVFLTSFQKLQIECGSEELSIQAFENKNDGTFIIRVNVSPDANKEAIENYIKQEYKLKLKEKDHLLEVKDDKIAFYYEQIEFERKKNTELLGIVRTMAESSKTEMHFYGSVGGAAGNVTGNQEFIQNNYGSEQDQNLKEAIEEIYQLVTQQQTQGSNLKEAQEQVATDLAKQAQNDSTMKDKLIKLKHYLGDAAANGIIGEAAVAVVKSVLNFAGIPVS